MKVVKINIEVTLEYYQSGQLAASSEILPLRNREDGSFSDQGIVEYFDFLKDVQYSLKAAGYKIIKNYFSDKDESFSYYIAAYDEGQSIDDDIKVIFFIRISDHGLSKSNAEKQTDYFCNQGQRLKQPQYKRYQRTKVRNVTVNSDNFSTYRDAINYIDQMLEDMRDDY